MARGVGHIRRMPRRHRSSLSFRSVASAFALLATSAFVAQAQADGSRTVAAPRTLMPIEFEHSAEFGWLNKRVQARRTLDDMSQSTWTMTGAGTLTWPTAPGVAAVSP